ncbi:NAD-binding protein [Pseudodesulfovibrio thermohalotolerans]|jgi:trk system potassium uptake protein TrkA|uniref:potassium channel family protein n=1 Tax=Pseudodesulfovibrio thermohalotolerans TaxID=2880651 RepID=UPI00244128E5|nr:NAD-binding protein [Pseudodesulfovibrio thermohalotolerans]WFS63094.1 NAD-binding protein [Pseudodesulfovibrio thermohalotolerans]
MRVIIVGGGKALYFLGRNFASKGYEAAIVNKDPGECRRLARDLSVEIICGDGSDEHVLEQAGARRADAVLAITPRDQDNLVICQLASLQFGVPRTVALANDPDNVEVFEALGVSAFSTTNIVGSLIEQHAALEEITNLLPVGEGRVNVTEIVLSSDAPVVDRPLKDIRLPENTLVAVVIRGGDPLVPRGDSVLRGGDTVVLITLPENHGAALKALTGEGR